MFNRWASIGGFHNVRKTLSLYEHLHSGTIMYRGKVKLHGSNAGIVITPDNEVVAQSRTSCLTPTEDNHSFAKWVALNNKYWERLGNTDGAVTIYGEWCGPGIQKKTAINQIPNKVFAVFAIQYGDTRVDDDGQGHAKVIIDPDVIKIVLGGMPDDVHVLPWYGDEISVDYADTPSMESAINIMNAAVADIEATDPWVKNTFGVDGLGEGIVYYPVSFQEGETLDRWHLSTFMFKAKGEKHKVVKTREAVQIDPEVAESIDDYVDMVITEARLEQGAREVNNGTLDFEQRLIGPFIKWINQDIIKETADELEASELTWKQVVKPISAAARKWYLANFEALS